MVFDKLQGRDQYWGIRRYRLVKSISPELPHLIGWKVGRDIDRWGVTLIGELPSPVNHANFANLTLTASYSSSGTLVD